jgi:hypothetical protein
MFIIIVVFYKRDTPLSQASPVDGTLDFSDFPCRLSVHPHRPAVSHAEASALVPWFLNLYVHRDLILSHYHISRGYLRDILLSIPQSTLEAALLAHGIVAPTLPPTPPCALTTSMPIDIYFYNMRRLTKIDRCRAVVEAATRRAPRRP